MSTKNPPVPAEDEEPQASTAGQEVPEWYADYNRRFLASEAHIFILHGDIAGIAYENMSQRGYLLSQLAARRSVIMFFDIARGISFPDEGMRDTALALLQQGEQQEEPETKQDAMTAALASLGTGGAPSEKKKKDPFATTDPLKVLRLVEQIFMRSEAKGQCALIMEFADAVFPPSGNKSLLPPDSVTALVLLQLLARETTFGRQANPIFLLAKNLEDIHADLRSSSSRVKSIKINPPNEASRSQYINWYLARREKRGRPISLVDVQKDELARLTAGLTLRHIEDLLLLAAKEGGLARIAIKAFKDEIISSENSEVAEMLEPLNGGFADIGGMEKLKRWFAREIIQPVRLGELGDVPKGVLLTGAPGVGKTYIIRALAREIGFNAVQLNMENILGGIVGESEGKLKKFLSFCKQLAPVVVFLDELDQSDVSRRGNNSGNPVASNLFSAMLRTMGDATLQGKIIWMFASNRPDLIDSALKRSGRIDAIIPVRLPNESERRAILLAQAATQACKIAPDGLDYVAANARKYSASDLAKIVQKSRKLTVGRKDRTILLADATQALKTVKASSPGEADWYETLAIEACTDSDLLEPDEIELKENPKQLKAKLKLLKADAEEREERE
jgi:transitional endoplasmic reticulum ATPase